MAIKFSRHSKRRMALYSIKQADIESSIERRMQSMELIKGKHEFIDEGLKERYGLPIKIVINVDNDLITVITAYPLKKGITQ